MSEEPSEADDLAAALAVLSELRGEIEGAAGLEPDRRQRVLVEIDSIRARLRPAAVRREPSLRERVENLALDFETSHPAAADLVAQLSALLASMGI